MKAIEKMSQTYPRSVEPSPVGEHPKDRNEALIS